MADRILGHAPDNSIAQALLRKVLAAFGVEHQNPWIEPPLRRCGMSAKIVNDEKGVKYLSCWELLSEKSVEELVMKKCGRYHKLKQLVEKPEESNLELLRELFASGEEESTLGFLKNDASEVRVEELEGKTILLDIRPANIRCEILPLQSLMEMYVAEKERLDFEIITIPIMQKDTRHCLVSEEILRQVPWLVLQNPWQLKSVIKFFLVEDCAAYFEYCNPPKMAWDRWHPGIMRVIENNGRIAGHNPALLRMVNTWQAKAYTFTEEKRKELEEEERNQIKAVSNLEFLFRDQVKEVMFKGKMICFYTSEAGVAGFIRNALIELRDNSRIMDEDGKLVTILGKETLESPKDKIKELIQQLIKCPKECRKEILVELEQ